MWARHKSPAQLANSTLSSATLKVGQRAPVLNVEDLDGHKLRINWKSDTKRPTLVYIFRESCSWCARNMANIRALSADPSLRGQVIGLSLSDDDLQTYVKKNSLVFPVYKSADDPNGHKIKADGTPETFVISSDGMVTDHWLGAYGGDVKEDIEQKFNIHLPGLPDETSTPKASM
jgi:peroxiredoxin